ncbi:unnamed protein product [Mytilus coruscus]|uniref:Uncharacterized protein n=1 Tax=Mytilus coruscus TaxID=42192 RepID=A0A6J8B7R6_MYTCO|nr:unnamed protein product [Mytilus coruscus]
MTHFQQWSKATPKEESSMVQSEIRTVEEQRRAKAEELSRQGAWMKWNSRKKDHMGRVMEDGTIQHFHSCLEKKKRPSKTESKQIRFVREGDTGHATKSQQHFILDKGSEWNMRADIIKKLVFPECVQTTLRPDIVVWSQSSKMIVAIELTVPWEERCEEAYQRKKEKYTEADDNM